MASTESSMYMALNPSSLQAGNDLPFIGSNTGTWGAGYCSQWHNQRISCLGEHKAASTLEHTEEGEGAQDGDPRVESSLDIKSPWKGSEDVELADKQGLSDGGVGTMGDDPSVDVSLVITSLWEVRKDKVCCEDTS